jgi:hypothetical protein
MAARFTAILTKYLAAKVEEFNVMLAGGGRQARSDAEASGLHAKERLRYYLRYVRDSRNWRAWISLRRGEGRAGRVAVT